MSMNFVLKQPSNIAQMRAQKEGAYGGYILCYMQKKEKKVLRYAPYHAHPGCKKNLVCSGNGKGNDPDKPLRKSKKPAIGLITDFFDGGSGGIRTHVPLRTTAFRVRLVMTTSIRFLILCARMEECVVRASSRHKSLPIIPYLFVKFKYERKDFCRSTGKSIERTKRAARGRSFL